MRNFIVLARDVLNILNSGHVKMGGAVGFKMKLLGNLKNTKSGEGTLLTTLIDIFKEQCSTPIFTPQEMKLLQDLQGASFTYV